MKKRILIPAASLLLLGAAAFLWYRAGAEERFVRRCYTNNAAQLDRLAEECRALYTGERASQRMDESNTPESMKLILQQLRGKYQDSSDFAVFTVFTVQFESDGDMLVNIPARRVKSGGDGYDSPDIRSCDLLYLDAGFDYDAEKTTQTDEKPFAGNWYTRRYNTYSG